MDEGKIVLAAISQADGSHKPRPVLVLRQMPPFNDLLVCGVSSQLQQEVAGFDDIIQTTDADFASSGLKVASLVRLGFLAVLPRKSKLGVLGKVSDERHRKLLQKLSDYLLE